MGQRIVLLDSSGVLHSRFHACKNPMVSNIDGKDMDVAAVHAYCAYLRKLAHELEYDRLIHVLDPEGGSAQRFLMYPAYKGTRSPTHPVLAGQKALLKPVLEGLGHTAIKINGVESDDILGSLGKKFAERGDEVLIVTADKDLMQLVKDGEVVLARYVDSGYGNKTHEFYEESDVQLKFGVRPDQIPDWLALVGDATDNIPGVMDVGPKTATKWLEKYGTLSSLMTHAHEITGATGQRLRDALPDLPLYRKLTGIFDIDLDIPEETQTTPERVAWARKVAQIPEHWPDDINGDLRQNVMPDAAVAKLKM